MHKSAYRRKGRIRSRYLCRSRSNQDKGDQRKALRFLSRHWQWRDNRASKHGHKLATFQLIELHLNSSARRGWNAAYRIGKDQSVSPGRMIFGPEVCSVSKPEPLFDARISRDRCGGSLRRLVPRSPLDGASSNGSCGRPYSIKTGGPLPLTAQWIAAFTQSTNLCNWGHGPRLATSQFRDRGINRTFSESR